MALENRVPLVRLQFQRSWQLRVVVQLLGRARYIHVLRSFYLIVCRQLFTKLPDCFRATRVSLRRKVQQDRGRQDCRMPGEGEAAVQPA